MRDASLPLDHFNTSCNPIHLSCAYLQTLIIKFSTTNDSTMTDPSPEAVTSTGPNPAYITLHNTTIHNQERSSGDSLIPLNVSGDNLYQYSASPQNSSQPVSDKIYGFYIFGKGNWKFGGNGEVKSVQDGEIKVHNDSDAMRVDVEGSFPLVLHHEKN